MADQIPNQTQLNILTQMASTWTTPHLRLFTNNYQVQATDNISSYTEVTGCSWYNPSGTAIVYGSPFYDANGNANMTAPTVQWSYGSSTSSPVVVYGAFVSSPSTTLITSYNFPTPLSMGQSGDAIIAGSQIALPAQAQSAWVD